MLEWFPLLAVLCVSVLAVRRARLSRSVHADLRAVIEQQRPTFLVDAAAAPVPEVARALMLDPAQRAVGQGPITDPVGRPVLPWRRARAEIHRDVSCMIEPLGLELVAVIRTHDPLFGPGRVLGGATEMVGDRHGRRVAIRLEEMSSTIEIGGRSEAFELTAARDRWDAEHAHLPVGVAALVAALAPHPRWVGAEVTGGPGGVTMRRSGTPTRSWMHDLWLAERFADAAVCPPTTAFRSRCAEPACVPAHAA